MWIYKR